LKILSLVEPIAKTAYGLRYILLLIALLSGGCFFYLVLVLGPEMDHFLLPLVVCLGWTICLMGLALSFRLVPSESDREGRFFSRLKAKFRLMTAYSGIFFFLLSSLFLFYLSIRSVFMMTG